MKERMNMNKKQQQINRSIALSVGELTGNE